MKNLKNMLTGAKKKIRALTAPILIAGSMLLPITKANAQASFPCYSPQEYCGVMLNPFSQPSETTIYYGSGDVDSNGTVNQKDYNAMQSGVQNDMADVDGDGISSTTQDQQELLDYLNGTSSYLPGHWNYLQTREERESWLTKMLAVDQTDTNQWVLNKWVSGDFAAQIYFNFFGYHTPGDLNIPEKYNLSINQRFNLPVYNINCNFGGTIGHGMNAILTGENPLIWEDWNAIEPQNDSINVQPGGWNIPYGSKFYIFGTEDFPSNGSIDFLPIVWFDIDSLGRGNLNDYNELLTLIRPSVGIKDEEPEIASKYKLSQNYPNPFNSNTIIQYVLPKDEKVSVNLYNIKGNHLETLVNKNQVSGTYNIQWNASDYSSGIYFYQLKTKDYTETKKMTIIK